jgi:hypothetical protein
MRYYFFGAVVFMSVWGSGVVPAWAARISVTSSNETVTVGEVFPVTVILDTEDQTINAVQSTVSFPSDQFEFVSSDDSQSALNLWIQKPALQQDGRVAFSGIAPGGFMLPDAPLVTFMFKAIRAGEGTLMLVETKNLVHDGVGTEAQVTAEKLTLVVTDGVVVPWAPSEDTDVPEHFTPTLVTDPDLFDGADTLVFSTTDKGSGMSHFEIKEGWFGSYTRTTSPYRIIDQTRSKQVAIKAVDQVGNERVEVFYPQNFRPWYAQSQILGGIVILCLLVLCALFIGMQKWWGSRRFSS